MNGRAAWFTVLAVTATMVGGCAGPSASPDAVTAEAPVTSASDTGSATASPVVESGEEPVIYIVPPAQATSEDYALAPGVDPAAAKACAALNIGPEVYAAIGKATLNADSTTSGAVEELVCHFDTPDSTPQNPNWLAVATTSKDAKSYFESADDMVAIPGWTRQDISGVGAQAKIFRHDSGSDKANHSMYALKGSLAVTVMTVFRDVPDGADLSVHRYGAIANKIYSAQ